MHESQQVLSWLLSLKIQRQGINLEEALFFSARLKISSGFSRFGGMVMPGYSHRLIYAVSASRALIA